MVRFNPHLALIRNSHSGVVSQLETEKIGLLGLLAAGVLNWFDLLSALGIVFLSLINLSNGFSVVRSGVD